jgi:hypothetical protein
MTDIAAFGFPDDVAFARHLVTDIGVAAVPGQQLSTRRDGRTAEAEILFSAQKEETLARGRHDFSVYTKSKPAGFSPPTRIAG